MNTKELLDYLEYNNEPDVSMLATETLSRQIKKFNNACKNLKQVIDDVREFYPDANLYVSDNNIHLMLGYTHNIDSETDNQCLIARSHYISELDGGGW